jgi:hypothetical protein
MPNTERRIQSSAAGEVAPIFNKETSSNMQKRKLGKSNPSEVSAIGLGCMGISFSYGPRKTLGVTDQTCRQKQKQDQTEDRKIK